MTSEPEPQHVLEARRVIREWELRNGHRSYVDCLDGGFAGYQASCSDCDWRGPRRLRADKWMPGRAHKQAARVDAADHREQTRPA